jgi:hypothetical protein
MSNDRVLPAQAAVLSTQVLNCTWELFHHTGWAKDNPHSQLIPAGEACELRGVSATARDI